MLHALRLGLGLSFVLVVVYEYIFPSVAGVSRVVEILEVLRYSLLDSILFASILLCLGVILDQSCVLAFDVWRLRNKRTLDRKAV